MLRKFFALAMAIAFGAFSIGCGAADVSASQTGQAPQAISKPALPDGRYEVQQASYDDTEGSYSIALLNAAPPVLQTDDLKMARLTEEEVASGQGNYLEVTDGEAALHIDENFRLEYVRGVEETQTNPATGEQQTVIVRRESGGFWAPFAGVVAGQAIGNALFGPRYYVPPVYSPGGMYGYGGVGSSYSQAVDGYRQRYNSTPPAVQRSVRKSGQFRNSNATRGNTRNTGAGIGSNKLRSTQTPKRSSSSFGTKSRPTRSFSRSGGRRR